MGPRCCIVSSLITALLLLVFLAVGWWQNFRGSQQVLFGLTAVIGAIFYLAVTLFAELWSRQSPPPQHFGTSIALDTSKGEFYLPDRTNFSDIAVVTLSHSVAGHIREKAFEKKISVSNAIPDLPPQQLIPNFLVADLVLRYFWTHRDWQQETSYYGSGRFPSGANTVGLSEQSGFNAVTLKEICDQMDEVGNVFASDLRKEDPPERPSIIEMTTESDREQLRWAVRMPPKSTIAPGTNSVAFISPAATLTVTFEVVTGPPSTGSDVRYPGATPSQVWPVAVHTRIEYAKLYAQHPLMGQYQEWLERVQTSVAAWFAPPNR